MLTGGLNLTEKGQGVDELTYSQKRFIQAFVENNGNGTAAYLKVYSKCKPASAQVAASRLLSNVKVKAEIDRLISRGNDQILSARDQLSERFERLADKAESLNQLGNATKAGRELGLLRGLYEPESGQQNNYQILIQKLIVAVGQDQTGDGEITELEPKEIDR